MTRKKTTHFETGKWTQSFQNGKHVWRRGHTSCDQMTDIKWIQSRFPGHWPDNRYICPLCHKPRVRPETRLPYGHIPGHWLDIWLICPLCRKAPRKTLIRSWQKKRSRCHWENCKSGQWQKNQSRCSKMAADRYSQLSQRIFGVGIPVNGQKNNKWFRMKKRKKQ
jgi:hypothetical protein